MITSVSLKHTTENLSKGQSASLMQQDEIYKLSSGSSLASLVSEDNHLLFLYEEVSSKGVEISEAVSLYQKYPKGTVLTITQNCF